MPSASSITAFPAAVIVTVAGPRAGARSAQDGVRPRRSAAWERVRPLLRHIVEALGPKPTAEALGYRDEVALFHALEERERHALKAWQMSWLLEHAPHAVALGALAEACGHDVAPMARLTPEQVVERLTAAILSLPEPIAAALLGQARVSVADLAGGRVVPRRSR